MKPLITVIVPCYNIQDKVQKCINSITSQTYKNLEVIVLDDGSRDDTYSKVSELVNTDKRIVAIKKNNTGVSSTRNAGIEQSHGDYIMFVDGDDYIDCNYIESFVDAMDANTDIVIGGLTYVGGYTHSIIEDVFSCGYDQYICKHYLRSIKERTIFGPVNKLYRASIIKEKNVRFRENLEIREDGIFVLDFLKYCNYITGIKESRYYYIQSDVGTSLVGKFHENEIDINMMYYRMLLDPISVKMVDDSVIKVLNQMLLNMDITSIYKLFCSKNFNSLYRIKYINKVINNNGFKKARRQLLKVDCKAALKYYRPAIVVYAINAVKATKNIRRRINK